MIKKITMLGCAALTAILLWQIPYIVSGYPVNRDGAIRDKNWEGVLRVWVCQDWSSSLSSWLSRQATQFEKAHKGVRVSVQKAAPGDWANTQAVPPDILLFSPGMIDDPQNWLVPFSTPDGFNSEALRSGKWMGEQYALPVALGGYVVLVNEGLYPPDGSLTDLPAAKQQRKPPQKYALHISRGGALAALTGWDAGVLAARGQNKPPDFGTATADQAYAAFTQGNVAALVCTIDKARQFAAREAAGKGFPFRVETPLSGFCDQIALIGRIKKGAPQGRSAMADALVWQLTGKEAQDTLTNFGLLPVRLDAAEPQSTTAALSALYERYKTQLATPNAYGWSAVKSSFYDQSLYALMNDTQAIREAVEKVR